MATAKSGSSAEFADPRDRVLYSPIDSRPKVRWPGGARVAFWVSPNIEHYEYQPLPNKHFNHFARVPVPDVQQYAFRDFGNRVAFWRVADTLNSFGLRGTASLNLAVLDHFAEIRDAMLEHKWAFMSHGLYNTRPVYGYTAEEERAMLKDTVERLRRHTGQKLQGMLGPALSMTLDTPDLMAELGFIYHTDWIHDDQPVPIKVRAGKLVSVPYSYELNDGYPVPVSLEQFALACKRQFDVLYREGEDSGRVMCVALHPFLIGQPHYIGYLEDILRHVTKHEHVWHATADEIAEHYIANCYDQHVQHALSIKGGQS